MKGIEVKRQLLLIHNQRVMNKTTWWDSKVAIYPQIYRHIMVQVLQSIRKDADKRVSKDRNQYSLAEVGNWAQQGPQTANDTAERVFKI